MNLITKSNIQKISSYILVLMMLISLPFSVQAAAPAITVDSVTNIGRLVTVVGGLSDNGERLVSIFVLPEVVNGNTMDSVDAMLALRAEGELYQNVVYMNSTRNSSENGFEFNFRVPDTGNYRIFMDSNGVAEFSPYPFMVKGIVEYLNESVSDYTTFKSLLADNMEDTEATKLDKFDLFNNPSQKETVFEFVFANAPYANKTLLAEKVDAGIQGVLDALLNEIKSNSGTPERIVELISDNEDLLGVTKLDIYYNELDEPGRTEVKTTLGSSAGDFISLDACKICFDTKVAEVFAALQLARETAVMNSLNTATTPAAFGEKLIENKDNIGLTDSQVIMFSRLSDTMFNALCTAIIQDGDTNDDGLSNFANYADVIDSIDAACDEIGNDALALDIINNRENSDEIISILYEYEGSLTGLDKVGYEQLIDGESVYYQEEAVKEFLEADASVSLLDVVTLFNGAVENQKNAKVAVTEINSADFNLIKSIIGEKYSILGVDSDTYADYTYIGEKSDSKMTDLINEIIKYVPYSNSGAFAQQFKTTVASVKQSLTGKKDTSSGGGRVIGTKTEPVKNIESAEDTNTVFTDLASVNWAKEQILYLADKGIINGKGNKIFDPNGYVTREEFVKMLVTAFDMYDSSASYSFKDTGSGQWYDSYVASAAVKEIVNGDENGNFGVGRNITREDMTVLVYRALKSVVNIDAQTTGTAFADHSNISDYAVEGIYTLKNTGYVNGVGNNMFAPKNYCTRAEAAVIIYNVIK